MLTSTRIIRDFYRDSITLLQVSTVLGKRDGIANAGAVMASEANLALMTEAGLIDAPPEAGPNDLLIVVQGAEQPVLDAALDAADVALAPQSDGGNDGSTRPAPRSLATALAEMPDASLALIATPGAYAAAEARKALNLGLHVMMFSDNVELGDEIALKQLASERGLMMMGPDCGTAIINGVPLGFANVVRRGDISLVAASGTGLQQVSCLIHTLGAGVSQAIGTGGRDLTSDVGGSAMLRGLQLLANDPETKIIVLISKPPAVEIAERLLTFASRIGKPVVVNFLGARGNDLGDANLAAANTLEDAATIAVGLSNADLRVDPADPDAVPAPPVFAAGQHAIRALYTGGTFCYEALSLFDQAGRPAVSNVPLRPEQELGDPWQSRGNTILDMGEDHFTRGRSHPMIDPRLRHDRVLREAADPDVAVILFDVVLGYGSHPDPGGVMAASIAEAQEIAASAGRSLAFVGSICGTDGDPQRLGDQKSALRDVGAVLLASNARAVRTALSFAPDNAGNSDS